MSQIRLTVTIPAAELPEVLEQYDRLQTQRASSYDGTYDDFVGGDLRLQPGVSTYVVTDTVGAASTWYRVRYSSSVGGGVSDWSDPRQGEDFTLYANVLDVQTLKDVYLFGVNLTDDAGTPYPDVLFEWSIRFAMEWIEKELDIVLVPTDQDERLDYISQDWQQWGYLRPRKYPLHTLTKAALEWPPGTEILDLTSWAVISQDGDINLVPRVGSLSALLVGTGLSVIPHLLKTDFLPGAVRLTYKAGFKSGELPMDIREIIGKKASFGPLNIAGDLVIGAGIASMSIGVDGLSQSIGSTASATNAGYGARLLQYKGEIKEQLPTLKRYYRGVRLVAA